MEHRHLFTLLQAVQSFMFDSVKYARIEISHAPIPKKTKAGLLASLETVLTTPKIAPIAGIELTNTELNLLSQHIEEDLNALREFVSSSSHFFMINKELRELTLDQKITSFKALSPIKKILSCIKMVCSWGVEFYRYKKVCDVIMLFSIMNEGIDLFNNEIDANCTSLKNPVRFFQTFNDHLCNIHHETYTVMAELNSRLSVNFERQNLIREFGYEPVLFDPAHSENKDKIIDGLDLVINRIETIFDKIKHIEKKIESITTLHQENLTLSKNKHKLRPALGQLFFYPTFRWDSHKAEKKIFALQNARLNLLLNHERVKTALNRLQLFLNELKKEDSDLSNSPQ